MIKIKRGPGYFRKIPYRGIPLRKPLSMPGRVPHFEGNPERKN